MMYVLEKDNFVFAGPNVWHPKLFESYIEDDYDIVMSVPLNPPDRKTDLGNGIFAYPVQQTGTRLNPKIETLHGPFYRFSDVVAEQYYEVIPKNINVVKSELKAIVSENRWKQEISGTTVQVQGVNIKLDTNRGSRDIYLQAVQTGTDNANWKLESDEGQVWLTLSLSDLNVMVGAVLTHIQNCFDWEKLKWDEIDASQNLEVLDKVELVWPTKQTA